MMRVIEESPDGFNQPEKKPVPQVVQNAISEYVTTCWTQAVEYREKFVEPDMADADRRNKGEYDPSLEADIKRAGFPLIYDNLTESKSSAAESWIIDLLLPHNERPFNAVATPIPKLPDEMALDIANRVVQELQAQILMSDPTMIQERALELYDMTLAKVQEEAGKQIARAMDKVADVLAEGGFFEAFTDFIFHLTRRPTAYLKAELRPVEKISFKEDGKPYVDRDVAWHFEAPDPWDIFPAPNSRALGDSYILERVRYSAGDLALCKGQPGWIDQHLNSILRSEPKPITFQSGQEETRAQLENRDTIINDGLSPDTYTGIIFYGKIPAYRLKQNEINLDTKDNAPVSVKVIVIPGDAGYLPVFIEVNPDPLQRPPFWGASLFRRHNSVWGTPLAKKMKSSQDIVNMITRAVVYNATFASVSQQSVDINAVPSPYLSNVFELSVGKVWPYDGQRTNTARKPVEFFQVELIAHSLLGVRETYKNDADDLVLIPRYSHGAQDATGAATTSSGLAMLMSNAMKSIRLALINVDKNVIRQMVRYLYDYFCLMGDPMFQGDAQIVPVGVVRLIMQETHVKNLQDTMMFTAQSEEDRMIIGIEGRRKMLDELFKQLNMPPNIIPSEAELKIRLTQRQQEQEAIMQQQAMMAGGPGGAQQEQATDGRMPLPAEGMAR